MNVFVRHKPWAIFSPSRTDVTTMFPPAPYQHHSHVASSISAHVCLFPWDVSWDHARGNSRCRGIVRGSEECPFPRREGQPVFVLPPRDQDSGRGNGAGGGVVRNRASTAFSCPLSHHLIPSYHSSIFLTISILEAAAYIPPAFPQPFPHANSHWNGRRGVCQTTAVK